MLVVVKDTGVFPPRSGVSRMRLPDAFYNSAESQGPTSESEEPRFWTPVPAG